MHSVQEEGLRVGRDSLGRIFLMENHDKAYYIWKDAGTKQRVLLHIDAHHDMRWNSGDSSISIVDFICPALKEDIVKEVIWVVPDPTWDSAATRKPILRHLRKIARTYPGPRQRIQIEKSQCSTTVLGKRIRVCPLSAMPPVNETVLLDIDVDFFLIPRVSFGQTDDHSALAWCWPDGLIDRLREREICADLITVVYSVEGSYTPLKWKFLGDELALRLQCLDDADSSLRGMVSMREATIAVQQREFVTAEAKYREAMELLPTLAAPRHHLAHLYLSMGRPDDARELYQSVLRLDASYRTPYSSGGLQAYWDGHFEVAEEEYRRMLTLDPDDAYVHYGLGQLAARKRRWGEAERLLRRALALDDHLIDAYRALGDVLARQGRRDEAIQAYEQSLRLALAGYKSLDVPVASLPDRSRPYDPYHFRIHGRLARLYALRGDTTLAINGYRISAAGGEDGILLRSRLAWLYLKQRQWTECTQEVGQALERVPATLSRALHRLSRLWLRFNDYWFTVVAA